MAFSVLGFALASSLTQDLEDRERASGLNLLGGVLGNSPLGLVLVASAAGDGGRETAAAGPTRVQVPPVGDSVAKSELALTASGLNSDEVKVSAADPIGAVLGTDPEPGTVVDIGSTVTILVSAGVRVPDVLGMEEPDAKAILEAVGLVAAVKGVPGKGDPGLVLTVTPTAGELVEPRSTVTLDVSSAETGSDVNKVLTTVAAKSKSTVSRT
jgi:serine/threonine-protein kinase